MSINSDVLNSVLGHDGHGSESSATPALNSPSTSPLNPSSPKNGGVYKTGDEAQDASHSDANGQLVSSEQLLDGTEPPVKEEVTVKQEISPRKRKFRPTKVLDEFEEEEDDLFDLSKNKKKKKKKKKPSLRHNDTDDISSGPVKPEPQEDVSFKVGDLKQGSIRDMLLGSMNTNEPQPGTSQEASIVISDEGSDDSDTGQAKELVSRSRTGSVSIASTGPVTRTRSSQRTATTLSKSPSPSSDESYYSDSPKKGTRSKQPAKRTPRRQPKLQVEEYVVLDSEDSGSDSDVYRDLLQSSNKANTGEYQFTDANESKRPYLLNVVPKEFTGTMASFPITGTQEFDKVLKKVVQHYKQQKVLPRISKVDEFTLFWVEGRREIKRFFKPKSLRIYPPPSSELPMVDKKPHTVIDCLLVPKTMAAKALEVYDELKTTYERFVKDFSVVADYGRSQSEATEEQYEEVEEEVVADPIKGIIDVEEEEDGYFKIALKGKNNKQVFVKVNAETKISKIFQYYCQKQGIDVNSIDYRKVKMIFDDEPLDMDAVVGDTELEDEFEVQIHL